MASTIITTNAAAMKRAAQRLCALAPESLTPNKVLNTFAGAVAGPGAHWGLLVGAPGGRYTQPGLTRTEADPIVPDGPFCVLRVLDGPVVVAQGLAQAHVVFVDMVRNATGVEQAWVRLQRDGEVLVHSDHGAPRRIFLTICPSTGVPSGMQGLWKAPEDEVDVHDQQAAKMAAIVQLVRARATVLVSGATGVGKTTLINQLLRQACPDDSVRVLSHIGGHDVDVGTTRRSETLVVPRDQVKEAIQAMDLAGWDRVVLDEVSGPQGAHGFVGLKGEGCGGFATLHAASAHQALVRMIDLLKDAGVGDPKMVLLQGVDAIVHMGYGGRQGRRFYVAEVMKVVAADDGTLTLEPAHP